MTYTEDIKLLSKRMFLESGMSYNKISEEISKITNKKCAAKTIKEWSDKENWKSDKVKIINDVGKNIVEDSKDQMFNRIKRQAEAYRKLVDKGLDALKDDTVTVDKISEVVALIDTGIRGERQISSGLVSWKYIEQVVKIICEEVVDEETRKRIAKRLQTLTTEVLSL